MRGAAVFAGIVAVGAAIPALAANGYQYARSYFSVPLYSAMLVTEQQPQAQQPQPPPAGDDLKAEVQALRREIAELVRLLREAAEAPPDPQRQGEPALYPVKLDRETEALVARKVERRQMPPQDNRFGVTLTDDERKAVVAAYRGEKFDQASFGSGVYKCAACHGPDVDVKKIGGDFVMLTAEKPPPPEKAENK